MNPSIQNRDPFLNRIASQLGRPRITTSVERPDWKFRPQDEVLKGSAQDELVDVLKEQCKKIHTNFYTTNVKELPIILDEIVVNHGGGPVITWKDKRLSEWGLDSLMESDWPSKGMDVFVWDYEKAVSYTHLTLPTMAVV